MSVLCITIISMGYYGDMTFCIYIYIYVIYKMDRIASDNWVNVNSFKSGQDVCIYNKIYYGMYLMHDSGRIYIYIYTCMIVRTETEWMDGWFIYINKYTHICFERNWLHPSIHPISSVVNLHGVLPVAIYNLLHNITTQRSWFLLKSSQPPIERYIGFIYRYILFCQYICICIDRIWYNTSTHRGRELAS